LKPDIGEFRGQIVKAKEEAVSLANRELKAIVVKCKERKNKEQLLDEELTKARCYDDSFAGAGYINSVAPVYKNDEKLIDALSMFYASSKIYGTPNPNTRRTRESVLEMVYEDSLIFLKRFYLAKLISRLLQALQMEKPEIHTTSHNWKLTEETKRELNRYAPRKSIPYKKHYNFLIEHNVIDANMTIEEFCDLVQRAHFGLMYKWAEENNAKEKLRTYIHKLSMHYFSGLDKYQETAATSMSITTIQLSKYNRKNEYAEKLYEII